MTRPQLGRDLAESLRKAFPEQVHFWLSENIRKGKKWLNELATGIEKSNGVILLLNPFSINRPWLMVELGATWSRSKPIYPLCHLQMNDFLKNYDGPIKHLGDQLTNLEDRDDVAKFLSDISDDLKLTLDHDFEPRQITELVTKSDQARGRPPDTLKEALDLCRSAKTPKVCEISIRKESNQLKAFWDTHDKLIWVAGGNPDYNSELHLAIQIDREQRPRGLIIEVKYTNNCRCYDVFKLMKVVVNDTVVFCHEKFRNPDDSDFVWCRDGFFPYEFKGPILSKQLDPGTIEMALHLWKVFLNADGIALRFYLCL